MTNKDLMHASKEEIENMTYQDMLEIMEDHVEVFRKNPNDGFCNIRPHWMKTLETCIELLKEKLKEEKMTDIELLIKIPEEDYHRIASGFGQEEDAVLLEKIFKNGIPLSEHDRLVDASVVADNIEAARYELSGEYEEGLHEAWEIVNSEDTVPTIIPATKEGEEECT